MTFAAKCLDCGQVAAFSPTSTNCPRCNSQWREAVYDYTELAPTFVSRAAASPFDLWRYLDLLPVRSCNRALSLGEGGTPLLPAQNLGMMLGVPRLFIKDERQGPTGSFKDRQAAVTMTALKEAGVTEMVAASTGNVAISYSAYAARAGVKLWAFVTSLVPEVKMREIALYGSEVVKVTGSYDQAKQVATEFARRRNLYQDTGARTITSIEAMKTIAFEIAEQLAAQEDGQGRRPRAAVTWRAPDWYVQSISGGMGPLGIYKGFRELRDMGIVDRIPALAVIQTDGCAPMVQGFRAGLETAIPVESPHTRIETLATGDPGRTYTLLRQHVIETGGTFESVSDEEAFRAMHILAKMEGLSAEPAAAVSFAGLFKLVRNGIIRSDQTVVVNCTGHTMPAEEFLLGAHWTRDVEIPTRAMEMPEEGLLAALSQVAPQHFPRVAIIDDSSDARRLMRRILQAQGEYTILEAAGGREGCELIARERPDLVVLDLMMPEMDGFEVLRTIKGDQATAHIPVIVATAKELTAEEKRRLGSQIQSLMQKGDFLNDEFVAEVKSLLK
jgi:threonine synthase